MYALGHYGVALLVYAPVGFLLAGTDPTLALVGGAGVLALSTVPDYDLRVPFLTHRGVTHTLLFTAVVAALGIGSHILGDVLTPAGVAVFWPLSSHEYTVGLTRADNRFANWALFGGGVFAATAALWLAVRL